MTNRTSDWSGFANARSLAGIPTATGPIRDGRLFRSDLPDCEVDVAEAVLVAEDISLVLDLRSQFETDRRPSVLASHRTYRCSPLVDPRMDHLRDPSSEHSLFDLYCGSLDRNGRAIVESGWPPGSTPHRKQWRHSYITSTRIKGQSEG